MKAILTAMHSAYLHVAHDLTDRKSDKWFLLSSPWQPLGITLLYLYFVKVVGPRFMKGRSAYNLDLMMVVYNIAQIIACFYMTLTGFLFATSPNHSVYCEAVDLSYTEDAIYAARWLWMYHALKVVDLMETLFFILRKKDNQVSFLHVYHHAAMVLHTALYAKFGPGSHTMVAGSVNCLVHTVMYCYYFMTHMWPEYNHKLWWKRHITHVQMIQFLLLMLQNTPAILWKDCQYSTFLGGELFVQNFILFMLFTNFYVNAYLKKKTV